ncbi:sensor histidine kinase [Kumtagia ephedrae]|uniref:histidine kinase n=1 Tax=Kumtagia ephedrae TaxID=2116701 RepID=A0A2P7RSA2_9HYPH|nr:HAMP domain-containing sensor histidine kinase [Mesorhizobium ephedrae]PSJ53085.1 sensor histidine kinase [Mesorhizobium ephedrae]
MMGASNTSLRWKLSWQLSLVFTAVVAAVALGLCYYATLIRSPNVALEDRVGPAIVEAIMRDAEGRFEIRDTPLLASIREHNPDLWFVAATIDGATASYGDVPAAYAGLISQIHLVKDADIRGPGGSGEVVSIDDVETALGEVRFMIGGSSGHDWPYLTILRRMYLIYVPLVAMALPAIFVAVPHIVRGALSGLSDVVRKAPEIDPRRPGSRLPVENVPKEVVPLVVAFNAVLERLERQFQARQRFLVDAAHELRTPIAIMQTRIDGMVEGEERRRLLDDVARLGATAEQLLDFERSGHATDLHETVDLVEMARTVVADMAPLAIAAGYEISFGSEVDRLVRQGSPSALPRALGNLVSNAIDHGGNAGVISVSVSAAGEIAVADQGKGIAADLQHLVFEPFYRVTPRSKGAGLGLTLVKQIVSNHRGRVTLDSSPAGTTFTIRL